MKLTKRDYDLELAPRRRRLTWSVMGPAVAACGLSIAALRMLELSGFPWGAIPAIATWVAGDLGLRWFKRREREVK